MRFRFLIPVFFWLGFGCLASAAETDPLESLRRIQTRPMSERLTLIDDLLVRFDTPWRAAGHDTLTFVYRGPGREVAVAGDWTSWNAEAPMTHLRGTDLWFQTVRFPPRTRLDYKLVIDGRWQLDQRNPQTMMSGFGPNSELRHAYTPPRWTTAIETTAACRLDTLIVPAPGLGGHRTVVVVVPPRAIEQPRPFLLVHDGLEFLSIARLATFLARADEVASGNPAPICVCVPPGQRTEEYAGTLQDDFSRWIVEDLMPLIVERYARYGSQDQPWGSLGASYGGRITLDLARRFPGRFDRLAPLSPSIAAAQHDGIAGLDPSSIRIYLNWGIYDIPDLIPGCERFAAMLEKNGFIAQTEVLPQGHSWGLWRDTLDDAFDFLYGIKVD